MRLSIIDGAAGRSTASGSPSATVSPTFRPGRSSSPAVGAATV
ncbi:hypothetical protein SOM08_09415 [Hydrogenophaga sp. SNF1]|nr:hypothetical protein [Hydrogenophaga sp. SNF1]WQB85527.1 hypothetical protein SOM08_09415 [Hydrogenophaga sp. SNF1]